MVLPSIETAHEIEGSGLLVNTPDGRLVWLGGGSDDPSVAPGMAAPLGSIYYRSNGDEYKKTTAPATGWTLAGLGSAVVSQTADFGKNGNASANSYLDRAGSVPSNVVGIPIVVSSGTIRTIEFQNQNTVTGNIKIYEHDGTTFTLLYTLPVTASKAATANNLTVSVTKGKMLAVQTDVGIANSGVTIALKGLSL